MTQKSSRACSACQRYKRRCDKALPTCSLCKRLGKGCHYYGVQSEASLQARIAELEAQVAALSEAPAPSEESFASVSGAHASPTTAVATYPGALRFQTLFLDPDIRLRPDAGLPPSGDLIPLSAVEHLGDQTQRARTIATYFETIHQWLPMIGRIRLTAMAKTESQRRPRADFALLVLSMNLIQTIPADSQGATQDPLYMAAKEFSAKLKMLGVYGLYPLQASLLIAAYEMAHGIFPAAYISMGNCVTLAMAMGIDNHNSPQILEPPRTWIDWEERQRVWWLVVIFDRHLTAVANNRSTLSADPRPSSHLPTDDKAWDLGERVLPERIYLSSSKDISASFFARLAQAAHLLGEVINHCNDVSQKMADMQQRVEVLTQALTSFLGIISKDAESITQFHSAVGVCLSALLKLSDHHACESFAVYGEHSLDMTEVGIARDISITCQATLEQALSLVLEFVEVLLRSRDLYRLECLSPWILDCIYQSIANFTYFASSVSEEAASQYQAKKEMCLEFLQQANKRWKIAGAYIKAVELLEQDYRVR